MPATTQAQAPTRNGPAKLPETIVKRDQRVEPFDPDKITKAVRRCFTNGVRLSTPESQVLADAITGSVVNILSHTKSSVGVEDVQRLVIQQLWARSLFDAAEHYQIYREDRRRLREQRPVPEDYKLAVAKDAEHFPTQLQYYQFISKFARFRDDLGRRETWSEATTRVMDWFKGIARKYKVELTQEEWMSLDWSLYSMQATCSLRVLQMAGPALDRCAVGVYNCSCHPIQDLFSFAELLYILMQGTGAGFSVESEYVSQLPRVKKQKTGKHKVVHHYRIDDSTEGWCDALYAGLKAWFAGEDMDYDFGGVREAGARLKTKGGRSSGPEPLRELLIFARKLILSRQGGYLSDLDVHDLCCMIGKIVQVGGVRRASSISLSDLDSIDMRTAKFGPWWEKARWRTMANNSACYEEVPDSVEFMEEWLSLAKSGSGERGIFNRFAINKSLPKRRKKAKFFCNPCGEIILRAYEFCNLSICVARPDDTPETLAQKVRVATVFGKLQSLCTHFSYIRPEWKKNTEEERLLGVDITGHADCSLLRYGAPGREELLRALKKIVDETDEELSLRWGVPRSAADTCVKPAGDSAILFNCGSGISARFGRYCLRWVRQPLTDPVTTLLKEAGVPYAAAPEDEKMVVFAFPVKAPEGSTVRNDLSAIQQLENWLVWKKNWAEHSVSCTIYVEPHEWLAVGHWVYCHFDEVTSISFLPKDSGTYSYPPNEEITEEEYNRRVEAFPKVDWSKLFYHEREDCTAPSHTFACSGGVCEV